MPKFQMGNVTIDPVADAQAVKVDKPDMQLATDDKGSSSLKQETVAQVVNAARGSGPRGMSITGGGRMLSGDVASGFGASNATVQGANTRSDSRFGKKIERVATNINNTTSEQFTRDYIECPSLAESAGSPMGYNGSIHANVYRGQKISGATPAELTYERSVDFLEKDKIYWSVGQQIGSLGQRQCYPTETVAINDNGQSVYVPIADDKLLTRGDYITTAINFAYNDKGEINYISYDTSELHPSGDGYSRERACDNLSTALNQIELDREEMETNAGDEAKADWSPLASAINDPNAVLMALQDFDSSTGAEVFTALNKLKAAHSFQLNKAVKDGQRTVNPAVEAIFGSVGRHAISYQTEQNLSNWIENTFANSDGSAGAFIAAYDSPRKYNTKADILLQPRSLKMHLQTGLKNSDPLMVDPRFLKAFNQMETFSTVDGDYDPLRPIMMTDRCNIVHPFSFDAAGSVDIDADTQYARIAFTSATGTQVSNKTGFSIRRLAAIGHTTNLYLSGFTNPANNISFGVTRNTSTRVVRITDNATSNGHSAYPWSADHRLYYADEARDATHDRAIAEVPAGYTVEIEAPFDTSVQNGFSHNFKGVWRSAFSYMYSDNRNAYVTTVDVPLLKGIFDFLNNEGRNLGSPRVCGDDRRYTVPVQHSTGAFSFWDILVCAATPEILKNRVKSYRDVLQYENKFGYPFRSLTKLQDNKDASYVNFSNPDADLPLVVGSLQGGAKIGWLMPEFFWSVGYSSHDSSGYHGVFMVAPWYINEQDYEADPLSLTDPYLHFKRGAATMSWPSIRKGINLTTLNDVASSDPRQLRLSIDPIVDVTNGGLFNLAGGAAYKYGASTDGQVTFALENESDWTILDQLSLPREIGFSCDAPGGAVTPRMHQGAEGQPYYTYYTVNLNASAVGKTSIRAIQYLNVGTVGGKGILQRDTMNLDMGSNYQQMWVLTEAMRDSAPFVDYGVLLGGDQFISRQNTYSVFRPWAFLDTGLAPAGGEDPLGPGGLVALFRIYQAKLQMLPFIISPFDQTFINLMGPGNPVGYDIYDMMYMFGCCGFRAADFREDVDIKIDIALQEGPVHVQDYFAKDSYVGKSDVMA